MNIIHQSREIYKAKKRIKEKLETFATRALKGSKSNPFFPYISEESPYNIQHYII